MSNPAYQSGNIDGGIRLRVKNGSSGMSVFLGIALGALFMLVLLGFVAQDEASAVVLKKTVSVSMEKVKGPFLGSMTNGTWVGNKDIVKITAESESTPNAGDRLLVDVEAKSGITSKIKVSLLLNYTGTGNTFKGNITLNKDRGTFLYVPEGVEIGAKDGYSVSIIRHQPLVQAMANFNVDAAGPMITTSGPPSDYQEMDGGFYFEPSGSIHILPTDTDPGADHDHFITGSNVQYAWDSAVMVNWGGTTLTAPTGGTLHTLHIKATDRFGQFTTIDPVLMMATINDKLVITSSEQYSNKALFYSNTTIKSTGSLTLTNCTLGFWGNDVTMKIENGGKLVMKGPADSNSILKIGSSGKNYLIDVKAGSVFDVTNTTILAGMNDKSNTLNLQDGIIKKSKILDLKRPLMIRSGDVNILDTEIQTGGLGGGIKIDLNHTWSPNPVNLKSLTIDGPSSVPISIANASVWKTQKSREVLYAGNSNASYVFQIDRTSSQPSNPYIAVPYFIDSRSAKAVLRIEYFDSGKWKLLSSFEKNNTVSTEWVDGSACVIDISSTPLIADFKINWTNTQSGKGCAYIQKPLYGGDGINPGTPTPTNNTWILPDTNIVSLSSVSITNASKSFVKIESSGSVDVYDLKAGIFGMDASAMNGITIADSSVTLRGSAVKTKTNGGIGIISTFSAGDDWAKTTISGMSIGNWLNNQSYGILVTGGLLSVNDLVVDGAVVGLKSTGAMIDIYNASFNAKDRAVDFLIPGSYLGTRTLSLDQITASIYSNEGIYVHGSISTDWDIKARSYELASASDGSHTRSAGIGGLTLDVTGTGKVRAFFQGNITDGNGHGISIRNVPSGSVINATGPSTTSALDLDGVYIGSPSEVNLVNLYSKNNRKTGIYVCPASKLSLRGAFSEVTGNLEGGVYAGTASILTLRDGNISQNSGAGVVLMDYSEASLDGVKMTLNDFGVDARAFSQAEFTDCRIAFNKDRGIKSKGAELTFQAPTTIITANGREGLFADGGSLDAMFLNSNFNTMDGIRLWNVRLILLEKVNSSDNSGNGISIHIGNKALLGVGGYYGQIADSTFKNNNNIGIHITHDPANIDTPVEFAMTKLVIHSNEIMDLDSPEMIHINWTMMGTDVLGTADRHGKVKANMDAFLPAIVSPKLQNEEIVLLGGDNSFLVTKYMSLIDVEITPLRQSDYFSILLLPYASLRIEGGTTHNMNGIDATQGGVVTLIDATFKDSRDSIVIGCSFTIEGCTFDGGEVSALVFVSDSATQEKAIRDSVISNCSVGIHILGNVPDLTFSGCEIRQNDVGVLYESGIHQNITTTIFSSNAVPLRTISGNISLFDSVIDKAKVEVLNSSNHVDIGFTLSAKVLNEEDELQEFTINITRGKGTAIERIEYEIGDDENYIFNKGLVAYTIGSTTVNDTFVNVTVSVFHQYKEKAETFEHTKARDLVYSLFTPPKVISSNVKGSLNAFEDKGLSRGPENVVTWFQDSPADAPYLNYSAVSLGKNVHPYMVGSMLNISLKKDFCSTEIIRITVTDPHGKSAFVEVSVVVLPINDVPSASNARFLIEGVESKTARTGDNLTAAWDYYDVDNEPQPSSVKLLWYLNGELQASLEGIETVRNVQPGQYWNFTIYPTDDLSYTSGKFGTPVQSPGILVGNIAPVLDGITLSPENPSTDDTLKATPGKWVDPDSTRVYFHYEWQKKVSNSGWIILSAPDSPILPGSYFNKGDTIQVRAWITDGFSTSDSRTDTVTIHNTAPSVTYARLEPEKINEKTQFVRVVDVATADPDSDTVTLNFIWTDKGNPIESGLDILYNSKWSWPDHDPLNMSISVTVIPYDSEMGEGAPFTLTVTYLPSDTDHDGIYDDANGNGVNDPLDDIDDDNDGSNDTWEKLLMKDPTDPLSYPQDWDRDGKPDGDPKNTLEWMDLDDDEDGIPDSRDNYPLNYIMPGDLDHDGIGDDSDPDIDGDGVPNDEDQEPLNNKVGKEDTSFRLSVLEIALIVILLLIVAAIGGTGYAVYNGNLTLPTNAPPEVHYEKGERPSPFRSKREVALEALEDIDLGEMMVCSVCGEVVKSDDESCPNCGSLFSEDPEDLVSSEEEFEAEEE